MDDNEDLVESVEMRDDRAPPAVIKEAGISAEGTNVPGPEYCLLIFEGFDFDFFSGGAS